MDRHGVLSSCEFCFGCVSRLARGLRVLALAGRRLSAQDIPRSGEFQGGVNYMWELCFAPCEAYH